MSKIINIKALTGALLLFTCNLQAAFHPATDSLRASREMARLQQVLHDTTHLSFTAMFCFEQADSATVRDTMHLSYQVSKYRFRIVANDSLEAVQNDFYNLALYHDRDMAVLSRPLDLVKYMFNANITDTVFYRSYINKVTVADTGSYRKLSYQFKPGSPFEKYEILYDPASYHIYRIQYQIKKHPFAAGPPLSNYRYYANIWFNNYQTGAFSDQVFSTDPYFIRRQGSYNMVAPYTHYELINSLNQ
jgi:hypothetical protein